MDAPRCPLCKKNHYGLCNPKDLPELPGEDVSQPAASTVVATAEVSVKPLQAEQVAAVRDDKTVSAKRPFTQVEMNRRYRAKHREKYNAAKRSYRLRKKTGQ